MFPFWDAALKPLLQAIDAKRVVEIGALAGENTELLLTALGADAELHVIDPLPQFDPEEHRAKFGGHYIFHQDLSHNVLPDLPAMDAALIDGDHNWYTVYHELKMLAASAKRDGKPLPLMLMHDVSWPYGRRDLYYAPEQIPEEFRQPYAQGGIRPNRSELAPNGGLNLTMYNATHEGGERNGVMTGLDDFVAEHDQPLQVLVLPVYFGLAIVAERSLLDAHPQLVAELERLESGDGWRDLAVMTEDHRLKSAVFTHSVQAYRGRLYDHATTRYLKTVKSALVNDHYIEHESRLEHLMTCIERKAQPTPRVLRDPVRGNHADMRELRAARDSGGAAGFYPWVASGRRRLDRLHDELDQLRENKVAGDYVDVHPGRGGTATFLRAFLDAYDIRETNVYVVDAFGIVPATDDPDEWLPDLNIVRDCFDRFELLDDRVKFAQGELPDAIANEPVDEIALLRIGAHTADQAKAAMETLFPRVVTGGTIFVDSTNPNVATTVRGYLEAVGADESLQLLDEEGLVWTKTAEAQPGRTSMDNPRTPQLAAALPDTKVALTIIVVFYEMSREAKRTLHSLSRAYQQDLDGVTYEVIAIDNGSSDEQRLTEEFVTSFGPEFRLIDFADRATPTPVTALAHGLTEARGSSIAFMIDGAHVLTPKVLSLGLQALATYEPAIVATQQWYVGPGQQHDSMLSGYDGAYEDRLFEAIDWPSDGYKLFDIGSFIGDRDWFDGISESNCLFVDRKVLEQAGGFDGSFDIAGGSFANLDLYERLGSTPGVTVASILGEGSFHQIHGGVTTNNSEVDRRGAELADYRDEYRALRGRDFTGPGKPIHFVGSLFGRSKRTKPRRMTSPELYGNALQDGPDGRPSVGIAMPDELKAAFTESYWNSMEWREAKWMGKVVHRSPTDLWAYQEILAEVKPDYVIEVGTSGGGRAWFLASICDLVGHGHVISIGPESPANLWEHDRIDYVIDDPFAPETIERVRQQVGDKRALVILGLGAHRVLQIAFSGYQDLVPVGSYVIFEDTIVNGNPVWTSFGSGPQSVVRDIIRTGGEFMIDTSRERFGVPFNRSGFLKRQR